MQCQYDAEEEKKYAEYPDLGERQRLMACNASFCFVTKPRLDPDIHWFQTAAKPGNFTPWYCCHIWEQ